MEEHVEHGDQEQGDQHRAGDQKRLRFQMGCEVAGVRSEPDRQHERDNGDRDAEPESDRMKQQKAAASIDDGAKSVSVGNLERDAAQGP